MVYLCDWCKCLLKITRERAGEVASAMCMACIDRYTMEEVGATFWPPDLHFVQGAKADDNWESLWWDVGGEG